VPGLRIDHISTKGLLLGVWQAVHNGRVFDIKEMTIALSTFLPRRLDMKNIKFVVKVGRGGARAAQYVQRVDPGPIHMTTNRKLALLMGRFTAEDAIKSLQNSRCNPELESVQVST
jgi:hypothetical protein